MYESTLLNFIQYVGEFYVFYATKDSQQNMFSTKFSNIFVSKFSSIRNCIDSLILVIGFICVDFLKSFCNSAVTQRGTGRLVAI